MPLIPECSLMHAAMGSMVTAKSQGATLTCALAQTPQSKHGGCTWYQSGTRVLTNLREVQPGAEAQDPCSMMFSDRALRTGKGGDRAQDLTCMQQAEESGCSSMLCTGKLLRGGCTPSNKLVYPVMAMLSLHATS